MLPKMCGRAATFIIEFSVQFTLAQGFFFFFWLLLKYLYVILSCAYFTKSVKKNQSIKANFLSYMSCSEHSFSHLVDPKVIPPSTQMGYVIQQHCRSLVCKFEYTTCYTFTALLSDNITVSLKLLMNLWIRTN